MVQQEPDTLSSSSRSIQKHKHMTSITPLTCSMPYVSVYYSLLSACMSIIWGSVFFCVGGEGGFCYIHSYVLIMLPMVLQVAKIPDYTFSLGRVTGFNVECISYTDTNLNRGFLSILPVLSYSYCVVLFSSQTQCTLYFPPHISLPVVRGCHIRSCFLSLGTLWGAVLLKEPKKKSQTCWSHPTLAALSPESLLPVSI